MAKQKQKTKWWLGAILAPIALTGLGVLIALAIPRDQDDWLGIRQMLPIVGGMLLGGVAGFTCMVVSIRKNEERATWAVIAFVLTAMLLIAANGGHRG